MSKFKLEILSPEKSISTPAGGDTPDDPLEKILRTTKGKFVKKFLDSVENEMNKFYNFFLELENKLNVIISKEIYKENLIHEAENCFEAFIAAIERLEVIVTEINELCKFINLNVTAIRKILKKFDKKFTNKELPVSYLFLQRKLKSANSSLVYILQFKTIDEASAIVEQMSEKLEYYFSKSMLGMESAQINEMLGDRLLKAFNFDKMINFDKAQVETLFREKFTGLKVSIEKIDEANQAIRSNVDIWSIMARENIKMVNDLYNRGKKSGVSYIENEKILENLTKNVKANFKYGHQSSMFSHHTPGNKSVQDYSLADLKNNINIWLLLLHTLLYTMNQYVVLPNNFLYVHYLGYHELYTGIVLAFTPLGSIISQTLYFKIQNTYKLPLILSCLSFIAGNFLYCISYYFESLSLMCIGRFLIGVGGARSVIRRYFIEQLNNEKLSYYSFYYVTLVYVGIALGPFICFSSYYLPGFRNGMINLNEYTYPAFVPMIIWLVYFLIFLIFHSDFVGMTIKETGDADIDKSSNYGDNTNTNNKNYEDFLLVNGNHTFVPALNDSINETGLNINITNRAQVNMIIDKEIENIMDSQRNSFSYINMAYFTLVCLFMLIRVSIKIKNQILIILI